MTLAANELHLTQSGVSQHIKSLEEALELRLFDRLGHRLVPTTEAGVIFQRCNQLFTDLEQTLSEVSRAKHKLSGTVSIGMPVEFGNNIVLPTLSRFSEANPEVRFSVQYGFTPELSRALLEGTLDFAFVDDFRMDERVVTLQVYDETLHLCALPERVAKDADFADLSYVDYEPGGTVTRLWLDHHYGSVKGPLNVRAWGMNAQGVSKMILSGLGAGVLPGHLVTELQAKGATLHVFEGKKSPLRNTIRLAYLSERTKSPAAQAALTWFKSEIVPT